WAAGVDCGELVILLAVKRHADQVLRLGARVVDPAQVDPGGTRHRRYQSRRRLQPRGRDVGKDTGRAADAVGVVGIQAVVILGVLGNGRVGVAGAVGADAGEEIERLAAVLGALDHVAALADVAVGPGERGRGSELAAN